MPSIDTNIKVFNDKYNSNIYNNAHLPLNDKGQKETITKPLYQSTFLPIFARAEIQIKKLIVYYFLHLKSKVELKAKIKAIIESVDKQIPQDLINRDLYINGLSNKADIMLQQQYDKAVRTFLLFSATLKGMLVNSDTRVTLKLDTPLDLYKTINKNKELILDMWSQQKGAVRIQDYPKKLNEYINKLAETTITAQSETGEKPISLWQKAELDLRHENQMKMLDDLKNDGVEYAFISSHADCSKRCSRWQNKLVALNKLSGRSDFLIGKVAGYNCYSLTEIMAQRDKYGYTNNVINGFNCRHYLIPFHKGDLPPKKYNESDMKIEREINSTLREYERTIRLLKQKAKLYQYSDNKKYKMFMAQANKLTAQYKRFAEKNGFAYYSYRIDI